MNEVKQPQDGDRFASLNELIQAERFFSPGSIEAVDLLLHDIDLKGKRVLDIGCGAGSADVHLVRTHDLKLVTAIDGDPDALKQARVLVRHNKLGHKILFKPTRSGPLPFEGGLFDVVFSRHAPYCIDDIAAQHREVMRVLIAGGIFAAGAWLADSAAPCPEAPRNRLAPADSGQGLANAQMFRDSLQRAGFVNIHERDRFSWYQQIVRDECVAMSGELSDLLADTLDLGNTDNEMPAWETLVNVLDSGEFRPVHFHAKRPAVDSNQITEGLQR